MIKNAFFFCRTVIKLVLLWKHQSGIQTSPLVPPLNRDKDLKPNFRNIDQVKKKCKVNLNISYQNFSDKVLD